MGNVLRVFARDIKRLFKAPSALLVIGALIVLPSLYTWLNVAGFWNPYDNVGNLRVCIANEDKGAVSEVIGELSLGAQLVDELHGNDQLKWEFTTREEAMEQVRSGQAFAAFVIPSDFSENMATVVTGEFKAPVIEYYANEKVGPVGPKITDAGANALDAKINETFFSVASSTVAAVLNEKLASAEGRLADARSKMETRLSAVKQGVTEAQEKLAGLAEKARDASAQAQTAKGALVTANTQAKLVADDLQASSELLGMANSSLLSFTASAGMVLDDASSLLGKSSSKASSSIGQVTNAVMGAQGSVETAITRTEAAVVESEAVLEELEALTDYLETSGEGDVTGRQGSASSVGITASDVSAIREMIDRLRESNNRVTGQLSGLKPVSTDMETASSSLSDLSQSVDNAVQSTLPAVDEYRYTLSHSTAPALSEGLKSFSSTAISLSKTAGGQEVLLTQVSALVDELSQTLSTTADALDETTVLFASLDKDLSKVMTDVEALQMSGLLTDLVDDAAFDPDKIADFMMSPTRLESVQLYELNAYGTAMAPLFINLTLWIGVFMLMVIIKLEVDDEGIPGITVAQRFFGRWLFLAFMAACQAVVCCAGCLHIGVQTVSAPLFYITAVGASLAYLSLQYTLSSTLQHIGKAVCIILVFVQIPAATGLYPIEMTNGFFQSIYPLFPFTYGINAIRETTCGFYDGQWVMYMAVLGGFFVVFLVGGAIVRPYLVNLNRMFASEIEENDIVIGESVVLPEHRFRLSQLVRALTDREEFRDAINSRMRRFMAMYHDLKMLALVVGLGVLVLSTIVLALLGAEKVVMLTVWLIWFVVVTVYLVAIEYLRYYFGNLMSLEQMGEGEIRSIYENRNDYGQEQSAIDLAAPEGGER